MKTVLAGGRVFDVRSGSLEDADILIDGDRIGEVGRGLDGDESVDVSGRALLPGLFDCHDHVMLTDIDIWRAATRPACRSQCMKKSEGHIG